MTTTPNMGMVLPDDHSSADVWGTILNTAFALNDAHDHTTGRGVQVPSAALKINADVSWSFAGTNYAITALKAVDFTPLAATSMTGFSSALFANSTDANNLYYRNSAGTNVKITDGSTLNVSIVGGIGGDYTSVGALLDYDDATDTYRHRQQTSAAVRQFAKMSSANVQLFEYKAAGDPTVPTNSVRLASPAALAASYTLTHPAALPVATAARQMSSAGVETFSNTFANALVAPEFKNSTVYNYVVPGCAGYSNPAAGTPVVYTSITVNWTHGTSTERIGWPMDSLKVGDRIISWTAYLAKTSAAGSVSAELYEYDLAGGGRTKIGATQSNAANNPGNITLGQSGLTTTVAAGKAYFVHTIPSGTTGDFSFGISYTVDRP